MKRRFLTTLLVAILVMTGYASDLVSGSYYNPVRGQCSGNPLITADGSRINLEKLRLECLKWVAISPDLFGKYNYGDTIIVESDIPFFSGLWVIHDRMGKRNHMKIDFLLHPKSHHKPPRKLKIRKKESSKR